MRFYGLIYKICNKSLVEGNKMVKAKDIYSFLNEVMPFETQEKWDNSGLLVNCDKETAKVLCCLDVTKESVDKAVEQNCGIIVSHHPVIFSGIKKIDSDHILFRLIKNDISVVSAHTNFDRYAFGTSCRLAEFCGLTGDVESADFAVAVKLEDKQCFDRFVAEVKENVKIPLQYVKAADTVSKVFVVAGSGKDMTEEIVSLGCDCIITGETSYHDMLDLSQLGISCICLGHDESEKISVETLAELINGRFNEVETVCYIADGLVKYI